MKEDGTPIYVDDTFNDIREMTRRLNYLRTLIARANGGVDDIYLLEIAELYIGESVDRLTGTLKNLQEEFPDLEFEELPICEWGLWPGGRLAKSAG